MKTIKENQPSAKRMHRFNTVDAVILLLAVVCVVGAVLRYGVLEKIKYSASRTTATVSFLIEDVQEQSKDYLHIGDAVYFDANDQLFGCIASVSEPEPTLLYMADDEGKIRAVPSENGRVDIRGSLTVSGEKTAAGFYLDGSTYIAPNMHLSVKTSMLSVSMLITDIQVGEQR